MIPADARNPALAWDVHRRLVQAAVPAGSRESVSSPSTQQYSLDNFYLTRSGADEVQLDLFGADVRFFDTGHLALETHCDEIAVAIRNFLSRSK
jgi:hypothetical protein